MRKSPLQNAECKVQNTRASNTKCESLKCRVQSARVPIVEYRVQNARVPIAEFRMSEFPMQSARVSSTECQEKYLSGGRKIARLSHTKYPVVPIQSTECRGQEHRRLQSGACKAESGQYKMQVQTSGRRRTCRVQRIADCSLKSGEYKLHGIEYTAEWTMQRESGDRRVQSPENKMQCADRHGKAARCMH